MINYKLKPVPRKKFIKDRLTDFIIIPMSTVYLAVVLLFYVLKYRTYPNRIKEADIPWCYLKKR